MSDAFLDGELTQLSAMARVIPPIFLLVSAFLINMILSRLVALEREQIGLLKAIGYGGVAIAWHYLKLVILIAVVGIAIGFVAGTWLGRGLTQLYSQFYSFPFLIFRWDAGRLCDRRGHVARRRGRRCRSGGLHDARTRTGRCDEGAGATGLSAALRRRARPAQSWSRSSP